MGRMVLFDDVPFALKKRPGFFSSILLLSGFYVTYFSYYAVPYIATNFYLASGFSCFMLLSKFSINSLVKNNIARIYLLRDFNSVRIEKYNGKVMDCPLNYFKFDKYDKRIKEIMVSAHIRKLCLNVESASYFDPILLYAALNPKVD